MHLELVETLSGSEETTRQCGGPQGVLGSTRFFFDICMTSAGERFSLGKLAKLLYRTPTTKRPDADLDPSIRTSLF
jgi:hypothetical protein